MDPCLSKQALRDRVRALRPDAVRLAEESRRICAVLRDFDALRQARTVAAFFPLPGEPDIRPVLEAILRAGKTLLLPRTRRDFSMRFLRIERLSDAVPDDFGIPAPPEDAEAPDLETLDLLLMPLCAVDGAGRRLGQGGGCYDRFLAGHRLRAPLVGVALSHQRVPAVHADHWDIPLDACIFPDGPAPCPRP